MTDDNSPAPEAELHPAIEDFLSTIASTRYLWDGAVLSIAAVRVRSEWVSIAAHLRLHIRGAPSRVKRPAMRQYGLALAVREAVPMRRLRLVLAQIATGRYLIRNKTIRIVGWLRASAGDRVDWDPPLHWSHRPRGQFAQGMTHPALPNAHWLDMNSGPPSRDILRLVQGGQPALDDELSRRGNGIAGVRQLVRLWDASPYNWTEEQSAAAIVIAPLGVALDLGGASLRAGQLTLRVLSESTEAVRHGSIGVGGYSANEQLYDREIVLRDLDWQPETGLFVTTATLALPGSSRADIFLRHRGATIHQIAVANTPSLPSLMQLATQSSSRE